LKILDPHAERHAQQRFMDDATLVNAEAKRRLSQDDREIGPQAGIAPGVIEQLDISEVISRDADGSAVVQRDVRIGIAKSSFHSPVMVEVVSQTNSPQRG